MDLSPEEQRRTVISVFDKIRETVIAGNEGNFDRVSEVVAGQR